MSERDDAEYDHLLEGASKMAIEISTKDAEIARLKEMLRAANKALTYIGRDDDLNASTALQALTEMENIAKRPVRVECDHGQLARTCDLCECTAIIKEKDAAIARLKAALDAHQNDPVCGDHAETWYCARPTVTFAPAEDAPNGCFLCEIARLKAQRDRLALDHFWMRKALCDESVDVVDAVMAREFGLRIVGGQVEEITKKEV